MSLAATVDPQALIDEVSELVGTSAFDEVSPHDLVCAFRKVLAMPPEQVAPVESDTLRAALRPFAEAYKPEMHTQTDDPKMQAFLDRNTITPQTTVGDFRRAHEAYFNVGFAAMVEKGTKAWADVPSATDFVEDLRGNDQEEPTTLVQDVVGTLRAAGFEVRGESAQSIVYGTVDSGAILIDALFQFFEPAPVDVEMVEGHVVAAAKGLAYREAEACGVDKDDYWKLYGHDHIADVRSIFAVAHKAYVKDCSHG